MKKFLGLLLTLVMAVALVACGGDGNEGNEGSGSTEGGDGGGAKKELRMAITASETSAWYYGAEIFKDIIEEKTDYTVRLFANEQLGGGDQVRGVEMIYNGESDLDLHSNIIHSNIDKRFAAISLPFVYQNLDEVDERFYNNEDAVNALFDLVKENGAQPLGLFENGFRQLTNSQHPVTSVADMLDLKVRVPGMNMYIDLFTELGASPTAMAFSEVYTALQQSTIDGQENPLDTIKSNNIQEVQDYLTVWNYSYDLIILSVSQNVWDDLTDEEKVIFQEAGVEAGEKQREETRRRDGEILKEFEASMEVNELSDDAYNEFKSHLQPFLEKYTQEYGEDFLRGLGIIE